MLALRSLTPFLTYYFTGPSAFPVLISGKTWESFPAAWAMMKECLARDAQHRHANPSPLPSRKTQRNSSSSSQSSSSGHLRKPRRGFRDVREALLAMRKHWSTCEAATGFVQIRSTGCGIGG